MIRGKTRRKRKNEAGKRGYLRQHLAVASLTEKEKKKDIYLYTGKGGRNGLGLLSPHCQPSPPSPGLTATLCDALSDQVPVEVIRDLLTGTRRWNRWPRDHMVSWAIVSC